VTIFFFQIVMAIALLLFTTGFIYAQFSDNVSDDSCIGLGLGWFMSLIAFGLSFLK
jgi:hypothetical protein